MDVSRIEAYNPNKIRWQTLTAKEILKYEDEGVKVPSVYLQWAQNFINSVNEYSQDDITYEKSESLSETNSTENNTNTEGNEEASANANVNNPQSNEQNTTENLSEDNAQNLTPAQLKRKNMVDNGANLRTQAKSFTNDSNKSMAEAIMSSMLASSKEEESLNEIQNLEAEMQSLLSDAGAMQNDLKSRIDNTNKGKAIDSNDINKINELSKELEQYGNNGHNMVDSSEGIMSNIDTEINSISPSLFNALDFGVETSNIGNELLVQAQNEIHSTRLIDNIIGRRAVASGESSINAGVSGVETQNNALNTNSDNLSSVTEFRHEVTDKTGVAAPSKSKAQEQDPENSTEKDPISGEAKEENKDIKTAENDGTDNTDKINIDINEILKRKVRLGLQNQNI